MFFSFGNGCDIFLVVDDRIMMRRYMLLDVWNYCCDGNFGLFLLMIYVCICFYGEDKSWVVVVGVKREVCLYEEG